MPATVCPFCLSALQRLVVGTLEFDRCGHCAGTWLDAGKLKPPSFFVPACIASGPTAARRLRAQPRSA